RVNDNRTPVPRVDNQLDHMRTMLTCLTGCPGFWKEEASVSQCQPCISPSTMGSHCIRQVGLMLDDRGLQIGLSMGATVELQGTLQAMAGDGGATGPVIPAGGWSRALASPFRFSSHCTWGGEGTRNTCEPGQGCVCALRSVAHEPPAFPPA
ncbi:hypothetical protein P7K49_039668, partial [Saguinus oedipus]